MIELDYGQVRRSDYPQSYKMVILAMGNFLIKSIISTIIVSISAHAEPDPAALVRQADEGRLPKHDVSVLVTVKDFSGERQLREMRYIVKAKVPNYSLVETVFPERQVGKKLLMREDDLWFYSPGLKRPTRIGFQQRLTGEVSNGDVSRTNFADDYNATFEATEDLDKIKAHRLLLKANRKGVTYQQIRYWVSAESEVLPIQAEFMTDDGKIIKRARYLEPKKVLGRIRVTKCIIEDGLQRAKKSVLVYSKFKLEDFNAGLFNKDSLAE